MKKIPNSLLEEMSHLVSEHDRDEMAIPSYLHPNPALRWMAWKRVKVVAQIIEKLSKQRTTFNRPIQALDYGCGTGVLFETTQNLADKIVAVDLELRPAQLLIERFNLKNITLQSPEDFDQSLKPGAFDLIVAAEVLEHIVPVEPVLDKFHRALSDNGTLLISLPTENWVYKFGRKLAGFDGHYHHQNAKTIHQSILKAGFKKRSLNKIPLPPPFDIYWVASYGK